MACIQVIKNPTSDLDTGASIVFSVDSSAHYHGHNQITLVIKSNVIFTEYDIDNYKFIMNGVVVQETHAFDFPILATLLDCDASSTNEYNGIWTNHLRLIFGAKLLLTDDSYHTAIVVSLSEKSNVTIYDMYLELLPADPIQKQIIYCPFVYTEFYDKVPFTIAENNIYKMIMPPRMKYLFFHFEKDGIILQNRPWETITVFDWDNRQEITANIIEFDSSVYQIDNIEGLSGCDVVFHQNASVRIRPYDIDIVIYSSHDNEFVWINGICRTKYIQ